MKTDSIDLKSNSRVADKKVPPKSIPPEMLEQIQKAEERLVADKKKTMFGSEPKGFPNGMNVYNQSNEEGGE